ncbi:MAG: GSCFA domain-containing protein [Rhodobacteraceae bacterium]|nr:GSCFA domain-containing protein [Paracoccaceae bacterium]
MTGKTAAKPRKPSSIVKNRAGTKSLLFQPTTKASPEFRTWFRGEHTNYNPTVARMTGTDAASRFVLQGWVPERPMIRPDTQITAFGSCFAANISNWLSRRNYRVLNKDEAAKSAYVVACGEGMVNSFVIRQQFEWAWENRTFEGALWHGYKAEEYGYDPAVQAETKRIFDETDFFILTFGLSEVWYDQPTGNVFWRSIPKDSYDPARHKFRVSTVEENKDNLRAIYALIRKHRPDAHVLFTLSPIPLVATFRDNSCLTSNAVSKAVLRVAIDEVVREFREDGHLGYWPSYELVTDVFHNPFKPDRRHPKNRVLDYIMTLFEHVWCEEGASPRPSLVLAWAVASAEAGMLPPVMERAILQRRPRRLRALLEGGALDPDPEIDKALRGLAAEVLEAWAAGADMPPSILGAGADED